MSRVRKNSDELLPEIVGCSNQDCDTCWKDEEPVSEQQPRFHPYMQEMHIEPIDGSWVEFERNGVKFVRGQDKKKRPFVVPKAWFAKPYDKLPLTKVDNYEPADGEYMISDRGLIVVRHDHWANSTGDVHWYMIGNNTPLSFDALDMYGEWRLLELSL